jgi:hypothetical protein
MTDAESKNQWRAIKYYRESATPKAVKWVMKLSGGLIKSERQAGWVIIGLAIIAIIVSAFLFFGIPNFSSRPSPDEIIKTIGSDM